MSPPIHSSGLPSAWRTIPRQFFADPPEVVAPSLLGKLLARQIAGSLWLAGRIVEVEAYLGPHITATPDPAAHSFRGVTERNRVMFGPPGHAYVYFIYGMYFCMNVTCEPEGMAGCILIRALEPVLGRETMAANRNLSIRATDAQLTGGPGRLCRSLGITRPDHNGRDLLSSDSELRLFQDPWLPSPGQRVEISPRIGIRHAADLPLRFSLANHPAVSRIRQKRPRV